MRIEHNTPRIERKEKSSPRKALFTALAKMELPESLEVAWRDAQKAEVPQPHLHSLFRERVRDVEHRIRFLIRDTMLQAALLHALDASDGAWTEQDAGSSPIEQQWTEIIYQITRVRFGQSTHMDDIEQSLFLFDHAWNALSEEERKRLRTTLVENVRRMPFAPLKTEKN